jgi:ribose transport system substrate-binding protein
MRRRTTFTLGVATLAVALTGCGDAIDTGTGGGDAAAAEGEATRPAACDEDNPYLAVALPNLTNPYYVAMKKGFEEAGQESGFDVEVQIADDDDAAQLAQVQTMLQKEPCALALNAVKSEPAAAIVKAANDAGVPVFTVNVTVDEAALESQGATIIQYLGADNRAGGTQVGEQVLEDLGADAALKIGFVTEPDEVPTVQRDEGFQEAISANPNAEVVASVDGNVKPDDSLAATSELLQGHPDVNVLFASTGPAAFGALQAVSGTDVKVYGFCAAEEALTDAYPACVAQEPEDYGRRVVEQVRTWVDGGEVEQEVLRPLKMFTTGQTPGPGEVG